jgi:SpoVK/Ycf46/Vps4 family AAA+-type ATPase
MTSRKGTFQPSLALPEVTDAARIVDDIYARTIEAAVEGDLDNLRKAASDFISIHEANGRHSFGKRIASALRRRSTSVDQLRSLDRLPVDNKSRSSLIEEQPWPTTPLILSDQQEQVLKRFILEHHASEALSEANLAMRSNLLLSGPPGTGKSFIAGHIAAKLGLPLYVVRLDALISSLLGDTAKNIRAIFDFANHSSSFLFIDEIDAVAKRRDDQRELGEIKRVVNTLIQGLDSVSSNTVIIAATNHSHLLDPAIFRRFPYSLDVSLPDSDMREQLWITYLGNSDLGEVEAGSDIRDLATSARRASIILEAPLDVAALAWAVLNSNTSALSLPPIDGLPNDARRKLNADLAAIGSLTFKEIGALTGVSKQAAMRMAKAHAPKVDRGESDVG